MRTNQTVVPLSFSPTMPTLKGVSATAEPTADRPEVAVVRHPIADARSSVVGYELRFGGAVDLGDPRARRQGDLGAARRGVRRHGPRGPRRPPSRLDHHRPQLPRGDRPAAGAPRPRRAAD